MPVNGIVVHYVGNPGTTAAQNRSYFESLASTHAAKASSNFLIGLDGEVLLSVPPDEVALLFQRTQQRHFVHRLLPPGR